MIRSFGVTLTFLFFTVLVTVHTNAETRINYTFRGENPLWTAVYQVNGVESYNKVKGAQQYDGRLNTVVTVTYKKAASDLAAAGNITISYKIGNGSAWSMDYGGIMPEQKSFMIVLSDTWSVIKKNDKVQIGITYGGQTQTVNLKKTG